jgi:hypothetical protein
VASNRWAKYDVELEEDDLRRILLGAKVEPSVVPVEAAYWLLDIEAELSLTRKLISRHGYQADARIEELRELKKKILTELKDKIIPELR